MPTVATKVSPALAKKVQRAAADQKTTVSALVRKAVENEVAREPGESFGRRFSHLFGAGKDLPP